MHHELSFAEKVGIYLDQNFSIEELGRIRRLVVGIGKMAMIDNEHITSAFKLVKGGSNFSHIDIEFVTEEVRYSCRKCGNEFSSSDYELRCPECEGELRVLSGDEIYIKEIKYL